LKAGYGRGYYGEGQLARSPVRRRSVWSKIALAAGVVGAGAVIWVMWPRKPKCEPGHSDAPLPAPPGPLPLAQETLLPGAEVRGFPPQAYSPQGHAYSSPGGPHPDAEPRGYEHSSARALPPGAESRGYEHSPARALPPGAESRGYEHSPARALPPGPEYAHSTVRALPPGAAPGRARSLPPGEIMSQQAYEEAVLASARQLQATGAKVVFAPHLAHLAHRLGT